MFPVPFDPPSKAYENSKTFYFFFTINLFLALFVYLCIPETKQISLEEIDVLFGGSNHVEKGGNLLHVDDAHHAVPVGVDLKTIGRDEREGTVE